MRKKFTGQPEHVINFFFYVAEQMRQYMAEMGFRTVDKMVGRVDMLDTQPAVDHWKARGIDLSAILYNSGCPAAWRGGACRRRIMGCRLRSIIR